ncbi:nickel ABC transporter permease subunit NikB [Methylobacterium radiotolerans]|uniref:nickel ABC transporter permease subunit NikB n=1 Tax=Methylobacterium radiotolerans TaxID=31998 RepID=UPI001F2B484D|nr:nickel ABC transporter permease subunit NikB [Methylobacterium radiotolerans]UIY44792.1 nickel ABC transporter permease subunit NikB [Methylobacterium radiotolerans]
MLRFIAARLALIPPMLLGVSILVFVMLRLGQGDPALDYLRLSQIPPTDAALADAHILLGLDRPFVVQYLDWLWRALQGDFGLSYVTRRPVLPELLGYLPATLELAGTALAVTIAVSLPLGAWAAAHRGGWQDRLVRGIAVLGVSLPNFWIAFLLVALFSVTLGWLPPMGRGTLAHLVMPALAICLMSLSVNARLLRASMLEVAGTRHVLYARLRGLPERTVRRRHVFRNALVPVVTATGMHVGELLGGALVVETIFSWPGVGRYAVSAIYNRDYPVIQCFTLVMTAVFVLCNLAVDIAYAWLDPRMRLAGEATA